MYNTLYNFASQKRRQLVFLYTRHFGDYSFIHINKTGGSSIEKALGAPLIHETALTFRERIGHHRWDQRFSFAIIRNPWNRAVSQYHYRVMTGQTRLSQKLIPFRDWLTQVFIERSPEFLNEEKMFLPQTDWVCDENGKIMVDYIGRFERLQESWDYICEQLGRNKSELPHIKRSSRGNYRDYYDSESQAIVAHYFRSDIEYFGYSF